MFGQWGTVEKNSKIMMNIKDVMDTIVSHHEFSFVTGERIIIMQVNSRMDFDEIDGILKEFLLKEVSTYFLMPKPRKLGFRLDDKLEEHLFGKNIQTNTKQINPEVAKALSEQLKHIIDNKFKNLVTELDKPVRINKIIQSLRPLNIDILLDKIIDDGLESLTQEELEFLNNYKK